MKKILFIIPHLSTGGLPQVVVNKVEQLKNDYEVKCIEYDFLGDAFVIQRNRLINLIGIKNLITLPNDDKNILLNVISEYNPDIISIEEFPEYFMSDEITKKIYKENRFYSIIETTHDSSFNPIFKRWFPDKFIFVSAFNAFKYSMFDVPYEIIEYPIDKKNPDKYWALGELGLDSSYKHVVCVGLFTERKNQKYLFEIANLVKNEKILFHFLGNQADNFASYWKPLMDSKPNNCVVWGERGDVDVFLQACDIFFFPSKGDRNNKELNPIAIKEALSYDLHMMMFNLDVYCNKYNNQPNVTFLTGNLIEDKNNLLNILKKENKDYKKLFWSLTKEGDEVLRDLEEEHKNFSQENYNLGLVDSINYQWKEMFHNFDHDDNGCDYERMGCKINKGDVVLDIGANIGIFAHRAETKGASKVISFEPLTPTFNCLKKNKGDKTEVHKMAIGSEDGFKIFKIHTDYTHVGGGTSDPSNKLEDKKIIYEEKVQVISINKIFETLVDKVDFMKMDIEGGELEVLSSIKDEHLKKLRCFSAEFHSHDENFDLFQNNFISRMENLGFDHFTLFYGGGLRTVSFWKKNIKKEKNNMNDSINILYEQNENKIIFQNITNKEFECNVIIKDILSNHTIYWFNANFGPNSSFWAIPCPKQFFEENIINNNNFKGYKIDFYNKEKTEIIFSKEILIDEYATNFYNTLTVNPFNCSYINYVEFFIKRFYDDYNIIDFDVVIDAGANDGLVTELFLNKGAKRVYCFEPDKRSIKYLKEKFINDKRVTIIEKGLFNANEYDVKFKINNDASTVTSLEKVNEKNSPNQDYFLSEIMTFDKFLSDYNISKISLFKIDIEGAEFDLLKSITEEDKSKVNQFLIECHWIDEVKIKTLLEVFKNGYDLEFRLHTDKNQIIPFDELLNHEMVTLLATNKNLINSKNKKVPSIEVRHMLCKPDDEREIRSILSIDSIKGHNITHKKFINPPYNKKPPIDSCYRPNDIAEKPGGTNLTSGHYGCYKSHIDAILDCTPNDDIIYLFFECDAILNTDTENFINKIYEANQICKKYGYNFFSLGPIYELDKKYSDHLSSKKLFEAHAYIIPGNKINYVKDVIKNSKWDVFDLWVSHVFPKQRVGHFEIPLSLQAKGFSLIDQKESTKNYLNLEKI